jgi:urease accessory protein UreH
LILGPHATIIQTGASLDQCTAVSVARGGVALLSEVLVLGRLASGERYAFDRLTNALEVSDASGAPLYSEACALTPTDDLATAMSGKGALVSIYALGMPARNALTALETLHVDAYPLAGHSALPHDAGVVVRMLAEIPLGGPQFRHAGYELPRVVRSGRRAACRRANREQRREVDHHRLTPRVVRHVHHPRHL